MCVNKILTRYGFVYPSQPLDLNFITNWNLKHFMEEFKWFFNTDMFVFHSTTGATANLLSNYLILDFT